MMATVEDAKRVVAENRRRYGVLEPSDLDDIERTLGRERRLNIEESFARAARSGAQPIIT